MTEKGFQFGDMECVFAEGVIVRDGLGFGVDEKFVGVASAGFAIEGGTPLAKDFLQFFLLMGGELFNGFDSQGAQGTFGDFPYAWNLANWEWCQKACFHPRSNPDKSFGLALVRGNFGDKPCGGESAGAGKAGLCRDGAQKFVCG